MSPNLKTALTVFSGVLFAAVIFSLVWVVYSKKGFSHFLSPVSFDKNDSSGKSNAPAKDAQNPLTGILYTKEDATPWVDNRPLAVMINNHVDARPQSGLIDTDLVYEMVAEGGITRYLAFFLTNTPTKIGPVRSTREYYLVLVKELGDAMLMHIGYSPQALIDIETWPVRSLSRGGATFWRDLSRNVAIEHTAYVNGVDLRKKGDELGWSGFHSFDVWKFKDDASKYNSLTAANNISVDFWYKGDYSVNWKYDPSTNSYLRFLGYDEKNNPIPHIDNETKKQITAKNVIVQFATEISIPGDEKHRLDYQLIGSGTGYVFEDGRVISITWSKAERDARTKFYDLNGGEVEFNRGNFWIEIVADRNTAQVVYK